MQGLDDEGPEVDVRAEMDRRTIVEDKTMSMRRKSNLAAAFLLILGSTACVSETRVNNKVVDDPERYESYTEGEQAELGDPNEKRIEEAVDAVAFERGPKLLANIQFLIAQKQLAVEPILTVLPNSSARARACYLYILGFTRTPESHQALVDNIGHDDVVVRYEAGAGLLSQGDLSGVPILITLLDHEDRQMRYKAIEALRSGTGKDFGYQFAAPDDVRTASIVKWSKWWDNEKARLMVRPASIENR